MFLNSTCINSLPLSTLAVCSSSFAPYDIPLVHRSNAVNQRTPPPQFTVQFILVISFNGFKHYWWCWRQGWYSRPLMTEGTLVLADGKGCRGGKDELAWKYIKWDPTGSINSNRLSNYPISPLQVGPTAKTRCLYWFATFCTLSLSLTLSFFAWVVPIRFDVTDVRGIKIVHYSEQWDSTWTYSLHWKYTYILRHILRQKAGFGNS
jgi:hypothetical protein